MYSLAWSFNLINITLKEHTPFRGEMLSDGYKGAHVNALNPSLKLF
ncbi:hypothetical protein [Vibrio vulnificus YJ016]|uniref:Uncharacterized protein n=1 Tax=Vibrio vulnificus (strain YJ016) TaxID=196600 RepID=Q7MNY9_VIBVY|nr:hypothetical protein [Vibrio vulnificus YJ016]